ncbi:MAG: chromosomal replication initiator DnaA, partial [Rubellimicrobium sp.]|nr:chromosomal replication initiator DnaA [Rubellimicrobium sp.]
GPEGAGKSHLVRLWQTANGAETRTARALALQPALPPPGGHLAVEDMDHLPTEAQAPLFHIHNHLAATGGSLLMTARTPPIRWPITLPDLASRLQATAVIRIEDPDDRLLHAILAKLFADRQITPPPALLDWLARRIERSFAAARRIVTALDTAALETGRPASIALARTLLDKTGPEAE